MVWIDVPKKKVETIIFSGTKRDKYEDDYDRIGDLLLTEEKENKREKIIERGNKNIIKKMNEEYEIKKLKNQLNSQESELYN